MLDRKAFISISNCLDIEGRKLLTIKTGRKPTCWKCSVTGHLDTSCPEKKRPPSPDTRFLAPLHKVPRLKNKPQIPTPVLTSDPSQKNLYCRHPLKDRGVRLLTLKIRKTTTLLYNIGENVCHVSPINSKKNKLKELK